MTSAVVREQIRYGLEELAEHGQKQKKWSTLFDLNNCVSKKPRLSFFASSCLTNSSVDESGRGIT